MDKTLEIIMVAVALVVALVIVTSILQGQASNFGNMSRSQTNDASCGISQSQFCNAYSGSGSPSGRASDIKTDAVNNGCAWATSGSASSGFGC